MSISRYVLDRLRTMEKTDEQNIVAKRASESKLINTNFEDNHGVVVSGGQNEITIIMNDGKVKTGIKKKTSRPIDVDVLDTPKARRIWKVAKKEGWVDANRQPLLSSYKAAILASVISSELELKPKWKPLEDLWGLKGISSLLCRCMEFDYYSETIKTFSKALK